MMLWLVYVKIISSCFHPSIDPGRNAKEAPSKAVKTVLVCHRKNAAEVIHAKHCVCS